MGGRGRKVLHLQIRRVCVVNTRVQELLSATFMEKVLYPCTHVTRVHTATDLNVLQSPTSGCFSDTLDLVISWWVEVKIIRIRCIWRGTWKSACWNETDNTNDWCHSKLLWEGQGVVPLGEGIPLYYTLISTGGKRVPKNSRTMRRLFIYVTTITLPFKE